MTILTTFWSFLEVNTQPGMTPTSLVPEQAAHAGRGFRRLVLWITEDAYARGGAGGLASTGETSGQGAPKAARGQSAPAARAAAPGAAQPHGLSPELALTGAAADPGARRIGADAGHRPSRPAPGRRRRRRASTASFGRGGLPAAARARSQGASPMATADIVARRRRLPEPAARWASTSTTLRQPRRAGGLGQGSPRRAPAARHPGRRRGRAPPARGLAARRAPARHRRPRPGDPRGRRRPLRRPCRWWWARAAPIHAPRDPAADRPAPAADEPDGRPGPRRRPPLGPAHEGRLADPAAGRRTRRTR